MQLFFYVSLNGSIQETRICNSWCHDFTGDKTTLRQWMKKEMKYFCVCRAYSVSCRIRNPSIHGIMTIFKTVNQSKWQCTLPDVKSGNNCRILGLITTTNMVPSALVCHQFLVWLNYNRIVILDVTILLNNSMQLKHIFFSDIFVP